MIDIDVLRTKPEILKESLVRRGRDPKIVDAAQKLDADWRLKLAEVERLRSEQKKLGAARKVDEAKAIKEKLRILEEEVKSLETERSLALLSLPNILLPDVPKGKDESENKAVRTVGEPTRFSFHPKDHVELGTALDIIDSERAAKVTGARFAYIKGGAALLQFALMAHTFALLASPKEMAKIAKKIGVSPKPFTPIFPPVMIRPDAFTRMGRLSEADKNERYYLPADDLYLIGSAEHTLGSMHMDEVLPEDSLPIRYLGYSTSFRREAGSYGKDTRGILRVHQFDKLEMESFTLPEDSAKEQDFLVAIQEKLVSDLGIPYRVVANCAGDTGTPDARQFDIEMWLPGQNAYRETHSADLMTDYQARRLGTKIKKKSGDVVFAHTNDATALAIGRTLIAIIENYQTEKGTVKVPKCLQKYIHIKEIIKTKENI